MKENWEGSCAVCQHVITNPVCPECKAEEVVAWQMSKNKETISGIRNLAASFNCPDEEISTKCLLCNKPMNICTFCFLELIDMDEEKKELVREFQRIE